MQRVSIQTANLRDLTYIAANLRPMDWREIACQIPGDMSRTELAALAGSHGEAWTASLDGQPVAAFGVSPIAASVLSLWAWGTPRMRRAVPAISRYVNGELASRWVRDGFTRVEARSIEGHHEAHRWMRSFGAKSVPCPGWGKGGENFILFWWNKQDWQGRAHDRE